MLECWGNGIQGLWDEETLIILAISSFLEGITGTFLERLAGGRSSFRDLGMGETAAQSLSRGMRRGQDSPVNKSLKKQAREPWNERKGFMVWLISSENVLRS